MLAILVFEKILFLIILYTSFNFIIYLKLNISSKKALHYKDFYLRGYKF
jgi:hypothetical protein